jgi:hypothetical protein
MLMNRVIFQGFQDAGILGDGRLPSLCSAMAAEGAAHAMFESDDNAIHHINGLADLIQGYHNGFCVIL